MSLFRCPSVRSGCVFLAACLAVWPAGCDDDSWSPLRQDLPAAPSPTALRETFDRLRELNQARAYGAMRRYIASDGGEALIDLLVSVDELVKANAAALASVRKTCPEMSLRRCADLSIFQDNLGLFSRSVEWVSATQSGDSAVVIAQISGRVPLKRLPFVRRDGVWRYVPGPENRLVVPTIHRLTRSLNQITLLLADREMTPKEIEEEYRIRVVGLIESVQARQAAAPASQPLSL